MYVRSHDRQRARWLESRRPYDHLRKLARRVFRFRGLTPTDGLFKALRYAIEQLPHLEACFLEAVWVIHAQALHLVDGSILLKPLKPRFRASAKLTAHLTGISLKNLRNLAEAGFIRCAHPTPGSSSYYPLEIEEFISQTEADPAFWTKVRKDSYLKCSRLRDGRQRESAEA